MDEDNIEQGKIDYDKAVKYGVGREDDRKETRALFDQIEFTHRERQLIKELIEQYLLESIRYCNLNFDTGIADYERILLICTSILRKISDSRDKFWEEIKETGKNFNIMKVDKIDESDKDVVEQ